MEVGENVLELIKEVKLESYALFPIVNAVLTAVPPLLLSSMKIRTCVPEGSMGAQMMDLCKDVPIRRMVKIEIFTAEKLVLIPAVSKI